MKLYPRDPHEKRLCRRAVEVSGLLHCPRNEVPLLDLQIVLLFPPYEIEDLNSYFIRSIIISNNSYQNNS